jgi:peptide deformylase
MAVKEILLLGNPVLRQRSRRVMNISGEVRIVIKDLKETLGHIRKTHGFGRGIAAPQIGCSLRIICINTDEPLTLINPKITGRSGETMRLWDDCFSIPGIMVKVKRHKKIKVKYFNESMEAQTKDFIGDQSELVQHEIDHLDGVLAIDRAIDSKHIILRSEWIRQSCGTRPVNIL